MRGKSLIRRSCVLPIVLGVLATLGAGTASAQSAARGQVRLFEHARQPAPVHGFHVLARLTRSALTTDTPAFFLDGSSAAAAGSGHRPSKGVGFFMIGWGAVAMATATTHWVFPKPSVARVPIFLAGAGVAVGGTFIVIRF